MRCILKCLGGWRLYFFSILKDSKTYQIISLILFVCSQNKLLESFKNCWQGTRLFQPPQRWFRWWMIWWNVWLTWNDGLQALARGGETQSFSFWYMDWLQTFVSIWLVLLTSLLFRIISLCLECEKNPLWRKKSTTKNKPKHRIDNPRYHGGISTCNKNGSCPFWMDTMGGKPLLMEKVIAEGFAWMEYNYKLHVI